jgi:hypothetical protein
VPEPLEAQRQQRAHRRIVVHEQDHGGKRAVVHDASFCRLPANVDLCRKHDALKNGMNAD